MPNPVNLPSFISGPSAPFVPPPKKTAQEHLAIGKELFKKKDYPNAVGHFRLAIDLPEAKLGLALCYFKGHFFENTLENRAIAFKLVEDAAQLDDTGAMDYVLSALYMKIAKDIPERVSSLITGAQKNNEDCIECLNQFSGELLQSVNIKVGTDDDKIKILYDLVKYFASSSNPIDKTKAARLRNRVMVLVFNRAMKSHKNQLYTEAESDFQYALSLGNTKSLRYLGLYLVKGTTGRQDIQSGLAMMATDPGFIIDLQEKDPSVPGRIRREYAEGIALLNTGEIARQGKYGMSVNLSKAEQLFKKAKPKVNMLVEFVNRKKGVSLSAASAAALMDTREDGVEDAPQRKRKNDENVDPSKLKKLASEEKS